MKPYLPIITFFFLTLLSCNQDQIKQEVSPNYQTITLPPLPTKAKFIKYSEVYDTVKLIPLETRKESLIGRIDKIIAYKDHFYILDQTESKTVFEFDNKGRFIRRFGTSGTHPGQYKQPNDISVQNDQLVVWDDELRNLVFFKTDGKYLKTVPVDTEAKSVVALDKDDFAAYLDIGATTTTKEIFNLKILNESGGTKAAGLEKKSKSFSKGGFFLNQNGGLTLLSPEYSSEIYSLSKNKLLKKYTIDFGEHNLPKTFADNFLSPAKFEQGLNQSEYATLSSCFESPQFLYFSFVCRGMLYYAYYSKSSKHLKFGNAWFNNVRGIVPGVNKAMVGNQIIAYVEPTTFEPYRKLYPSYPVDLKHAGESAASINHYFASNGKEQLVESSDFNFSKDDISRLKAIKNTDNPVLMIQKLKSF